MLIERCIPLPAQYKRFTNANTLKRFAIAYMATNYRGWKPVRIEENRVLARLVNEREDSLTKW